MRKLILALALFIPISAFAQSLSPVIKNGDHVTIQAPDSAVSGIHMNVPNAAGIYEVVVGGTKKIRFSGTASDGSALNSLGYYVATPAATAAAGTNDIKGPLTFIPTAASNAAAILTAPVNIGEIRKIINTGPNAVRPQVGSAATLNAVGTPGAKQYFSLATLQEADCVATSLTNWNCNTRTVPTPAP